MRIARMLRAARQITERRVSLCEINGPACATDNGGDLLVRSEVAQSPRQLRAMDARRLSKRVGVGREGRAPPAKVLRSPASEASVSRLDSLTELSL
jgi:hypothetical protein